MVDQRTDPAIERDVAFTIPVQDAKPAASEVRTFPSHGDPHVIFICPATSSFAPGLAIPIPIFPLFP